MIQVIAVSSYRFKSTIQWPTFGTQYPLALVYAYLVYLCSQCSEWRVRSGNVYINASFLLKDRRAHSFGFGRFKLRISNFRTIEIGARTPHLRVRFDSRLGPGLC